MFTRLRRWLRRLFWLSLFLTLLLAGVTWYLNVRWLPERGKALLARRLGEVLHAQVTIDELSATPWGGFVLRQVRVQRLDATQPFLEASYIHASVGWLKLLAVREARVRLWLDLQEPGPAKVLVLGRYAIADRAWDATLMIQDFDVAKLSPATRARVPAAVEAAAGRLRARLVTRPHQPVNVSLSTQLTHLTLAQGAHRLRGRADVEAAGPYLADQTMPWQASIVVRLHDAEYEGLAAIQTVQRLTGTIRATPKEIASLDVTALIRGIPARLTGRIADLANPTLDLRLDAQPTAAQLVTLLPALQAYRPAGATTLVVQMAGPTAQPEALTVTAQGVLQEVSLQLPQWPRPLTAVNGSWRYDQATQTLTLERIALLHDGMPAVASGTIRRFADPELHLTVTAAAPLAQLAELTPLLDAWEFQGEGALTVTLDRAGSTTPLALAAELRLSRAGVTAPWLPQPLTDVEGTVRVTDPATPHLELTLRTGRLTTHLDAVAADEAVTIHAWDGSFNDSSWRAAGRITRLKEAPRAELHGEGTVTVADLATLPWPWARQPERWGLSGTARVRVSGAGPVRAWQEGEWHVWVEAPSLHWKEVPITAVSCELQLAGGKLTIPELRASPAGGRLVGGGTVDWSTRPPGYTAHLQFADVDLAQATQALPEKRRIPSGTAQGQLELTSYGAPSTVSGQAFVHAQGENLANVPFLNRVLGGLLGTVAQAFKFGDLRQVTIQEVRGHFTVVNERLATEDLVLLGTNANFEVRGTAGFDKRLALTVDPSLSKQLVASAPGLNKIQETVGQLDLLRIGRVEVTGTWDQPEFKARLVPLNELLGQFLPNVFNLFGREEND